MKAVTPVISIIVLLLITVALAGAGWSFISGFWEGSLAKQIEVADSFCIKGNAKVILKNLGTGTVSTEEMIIIDLKTGHQPLSDGTGTLWCVHNGEIYNFLDLREGLLPQKG